MTAVRLSHLQKKYDNGYEAISDLNIDIADGEFLILVGPSGCGKSTALRMLAGLESITGGELWIGDRMVNDVPPRERDIAMVFQSYALYPHMSVAQNIGFGLKLARVPKAEIAAKVSDAAKMLGLEDLLDRKPKALSGGQRQRVAMGRAIVRDPKVFLMDEPLSNLDAKLRVQMRTDILQLQRRVNTTTVYVTHDQVEAMTMGDRVAVLNGGVLQQVAPPQELYDRPDNAFVAAFIGSPPMNLMRAGVTVNGDQVALTIGSDSIPVPPERVAASPSLRSYDGKTVTVGLRAEHVGAPGSIDEGAPRIQARVAMVEMLGSETLVHFVSSAPKVHADPDVPVDAADEHLYLARFSPRSTIAADDRIELALDMCSAHLFDSETGLAIR
jgi:multiple sugar transport system ATP-binding protein